MEHYTVTIYNMVNLYQPQTQKVTDYNKSLTFEVKAQDPETAIKRFVPYMDLNDQFRVTTQVDTGTFDRDAYPIARNYLHLAGTFAAVKYHPQARQLTIHHRDDTRVTNEQIAL